MKVYKMPAVAAKEEEAATFNAHVQALCYDVIEESRLGRMTSLMLVMVSGDEVQLASLFKPGSDSNDDDRAYSALCRLKRNMEEDIDNNWDEEVPG